MEQYESDTDGIRKVYDYINTKAGETNGTLDEVDVSYVMGALNMWLIDHEPIRNLADAPLYPPEQPQDTWNPFKRKAQ